jgi:protein-disulfide isomerase
MPGKKYFFILVVLSLAAGVYASEKSAARLPRIVAKVGEVEILSDQVRQESASRLIKWRQEQYKARLNGQTLEPVRSVLTHFFKKQQSQRLYNELINELKSRTLITALLEPPRVRVSENGRPSEGSKTAPVRIIEFSDYQCSFCARAEETPKTVYKVYGDLFEKENKRRVFFRDNMSDLFTI